jgi:uncharacterized protein (TIGR04222 family)
MWPFDLRGPEFLVVYLIVGAIVITAMLLLRHSAEPAGPQISLTDPYLVAFLRGGQNETLRVATVSLIDRGILKADVKKVVASEGAFGKAAAGLEQKIVKFFNPSADAISIFKSKETEPEMRGYENQLMQAGLLPDSSVRDGQLLRMMIGLVVLLGIGITKLFVAIAGGHSNVAFLIILMIVFTVVVIKVSRPRRTKEGDRAIENLRTLFGDLKTRQSSMAGGASPVEYAMMAAVFGAATIPEAKALFPRAGGSSDCGSSCGSSSSGDGGGDGGGSGCGGCGGGDGG